MAVVATAGHVDHGKSALVRALTGVDPDTLAEERRRGLTLELGHVHLRLATGPVVGIVDVPGHERYLGTALAGVAPVGGVLLCVAADDGWSAQTEQHARALVALGSPPTALVVTKTDRCDPGPTAGDSTARLRSLGLPPVAVVACSVRDGRGLAQVREAVGLLADLLSPASPDDDGPVRLWVDRSFTVRGSGTVVTGTLPSGRVHRGQRVQTPAGRARVRAVQCYGEQVEAVSGPTRVALNLSGVSPAQVGRGDAVLDAGAAPAVTRVETERTTVHDRSRWPATTLVTVGTATLAARLSVRGDRVLVLLPRALPLWTGDRLVVRDPGGRLVIGGLTVTATSWPGRVHPARHHRAEPGGASATVQHPPGVVVLLAHLARHPLAPATPADLLAWQVDGATLRALARDGRITYLGSGLAFGAEVVRAARQSLATLPTEFTVSDARQHLGLSRAVTLRLLDHLDRAGVTSRTSTNLRILVR